MADQHTFIYVRNMQKPSAILIGRYKRLRKAADHNFTSSRAPLGSHMRCRFLIALQEGPTYRCNYINDLWVVEVGRFMRNSGGGSFEELAFFDGTLRSFTLRKTR
jgi:hypothetical protein